MKLRVITEAVGVEKKNIITVLASACLLSTLVAASGLVTVQADPALPWEGTITLHATVTTNPYWGYYGGYHDIWQAIKTELAKIGITLEVNYYDDFTWRNRVWGSGWNKSWDEGGWDMTMLEWRLQPHALDPWFSPMVYSWLQPPEGYNIHPWNNSKADELLEKGMTSFDAETRKYYLNKWQEVFMHDLPWINIYYPRIYEVMGSWIDGYDPTGCWWYDTTHLSLDVSAMPAARKNLHTDWIYYAVTEPIWSLLPTFIETYTEEQMCTIQWDTLYRWSLNWANFEAGTEPDPSDYIIVPRLAASDPYPVGGNYSQMRVELRQGVKWSDGDMFDADDVVWTFNTAVLEKTAGNTGAGDFVWFLDHVEKVDQYKVDFILKTPVADFKSLLANDWGGSILPYHIFKDVPPPQIKGHPSNWAFNDPTKWLPVTGPFKLKEIVAGEYALLERNPLYFGFNASIVGSPAWGPNPSVQAIYLKTVPDPAVRLLEFQTYRLDMGEYPTAPLEVWKDMETDPHLNVFQYNYPASNPIWINFNNEYLNNRWIRKAIGHAVPYDKIFSEILPSWGIETAYLGKTYILPSHYYTEPNTGDPLVGTTVHLFNEELEPWYYDIELAEDYMELWWFSKVGKDYTKGALGDSDLSGLVDLDDFLIWRENFGTNPADWIFLPGRDIDPDFNNDLIVDVLNDFPLWAENYGTEYPIAGASALNENTIRVSTNVSPYIAVIPEITVDPTLTPGKNYTVSICTDYTVNDIWAWQFSLTYNPNILRGIEVTNGDLITKEKHPVAHFIPGTFDNEAGKLSLTGAFFFYINPPIPVTSGPGILANVTFTVVGVGTSNISMGLETGLGGVTEDPELGPGYGGTYIIIDAETMPDHIGHGYFDNTAPPPAVTATIDIHACLNLKSKGKWITAHIELPEDYDVGDIDVSTILLNDVVPAERSKVSGKMLIVKFDRSKVIALLPQIGEIELTVTGTLFDGTIFEGSDSIRVILPFAGDRGLKR